VIALVFAGGFLSGALVVAVAISLVSQVERHLDGPIALPPLKRRSPGAVRRL